ncbi:MAG: isocitrate lyase/phosphoenolpyruvate mutase family protein [Phycisphaerales bacterium]|nr:isocitrate lyase/phosphoenolpyruvate mutase family protein [Phycisphaerales bacterium]
METLAASLRQRLEGDVIAAPGAWNGLVARAIARAGFEACYISGGATANACGLPDIGLVPLDEMCVQIHHVVEGCGLPTIVDADTGYGDADMTAKTCRDYIAAGAAAMHLEDQVFPKRCGHLDGKELVSTEAMCEKIQAAAEAKTDENFVLIARTDARGVEDMDAALQRGCAYREAGADMIFPESLRSPEEFATFAQGCPGLLLANMTEFGKTPHIPLHAFGAMGYDLVIYPVTTQRIAMRAVESALEALRQSGTAEGLLPQMQTRAELYDLLDYEPSAQWTPAPASPRA